MNEEASLNLSVTSTLKNQKVKKTSNIDYKKEIKDISPVLGAVLYTLWIYKVSELKQIISKGECGGKILLIPVVATGWILGDITGKLITFESPFLNKIFNFFKINTLSCFDYIYNFFNKEEVMVNNNVSNDCNVEPMQEELCQGNFEGEDYIT